MKARVVVDSYVYISALVFGGSPKSLLLKAELGDFKLCGCSSIREEGERTLKQKFGWSREAVEKACSPLWSIADQIDIDPFLEVTDDPDDNQILNCAVAGKAQFIVTGDDDLLRIKRFQNIEIVKVRAYLYKTH